jgi:peptidoglycan/LPS O-acetylase OafA/YrhL
MSRRNAELGLVILAIVLTGGAYLLVDFATSDTIPAGFFSFIAAFGGMALAAHFVIRRLAPNADPLPLPIAMLLSGLGYVMVRRLNADLAGPQLAWIGVGLGAFCLTLFGVRASPRRRLPSSPAAF